MKKENRVKILTNKAYWEEALDNAKYLRLSNEDMAEDIVEKILEVTKTIVILKSSFIVRDWLTGEVRTFDNYDEAKENYDETVKASLDANGREGDCDVQLLALVEELVTVDRQD